MPTIGRQLPAVIARDILARQQHMAGRQAVHAAKNIEKRRLARAGLADDDADFPFLDGKRSVLQRIDAHLAHLIRLADVVEHDKILHMAPPFLFLFGI